MTAALIAKNHSATSFGVCDQCTIDSLKFDALLLTHHSRPKDYDGIGIVGHERDCGSNLGDFVEIADRFELRVETRLHVAELGVIFRLH